MRTRNFVTLAALLAAALLLLGTGRSWALGTASDQTISNTASVQFTISGTTTTTASNTYNIAVDNKVRVVVQSNGGSYVVAGVNDFALPFTVTNESNTAAGSDYFVLSAQADGANDFAMNNVEIYLDVNANGTYESGTDTLVVNPVQISNASGSNSARFLIVSDTPASNGAGDNTDTAVAGNTSVYHLVATASDNAGVALSEDNNGNDVSLHEIIFTDDAGTSGDAAGDGIDSDAGTYTTAATLSVIKAASNGTSGYHIPGDEVTYTIGVTNGDATNDATAVTIYDEIPVNVTFKSGSLSCPAGFTPEYNASAKGSVPGGGWSGVETSPVNHVQCSSGTIPKATGPVNMSFVVTIN